MKEPSGKNIFSSTQTFGAIPVGQIITFSENIPLTAVMFGEYRLSHTLRYFAEQALPLQAEGITFSGEEGIANNVETTLVWDNPTIPLGGGTQRTAFITASNTGRFDIANLTLRLRIDFQSPQAVSGITIPKGQPAIQSFTVALPGAPGTHSASVEAILPSGSSRSQTFTFSISPSLIVFSAPDEAQSPGLLTLSARNIGGAPSDFTYSLTLKDRFGFLAAQGSGSKSIGPLATETISFPIPPGLAAGAYALNIIATDSQTGKISRLDRGLSLSGISAERPRYIPGELCESCKEGLTSP